MRAILWNLAGPTQPGGKQKPCCVIRGCPCDLTVGDIRREIDQGWLVNYNSTFGAITSRVDSPGLDVNDDLVGNSRLCFDERIRDFAAISSSIADECPPDGNLLCRRGIIRAISGDS